MNNQDEATVHDLAKLALGEAAASIRVFLVDDHPIVRTGLKTLLREEPNMDWVGESEGNWEAIKMIEELSPDVVVVDSELTEIDTMEIARAVSANSPSTAVVVLTSRGDEYSLAQALQYEVAGFITRESSKALIAIAIRAAAAGGGIWDRNLLYRAIRLLRLPTRMQEVSNDTQEITSADIIVQQLSPREMSTLRLVSDGLTNKEIAIKLSCSESAVKGYVTRIMNKLNVTNRTQIALKSSQLNII
ncbi:MAG: response regulator transcription factor [Dehalogenimonas sp.]|jgi:DNA-binding NarL/FixJ family response regulator|uniref:Response regulator transcription factor n=1 Tax=Candidatus Dehalogenimonas loeffleri TaxID=3127115 RepID=A0ABZ2JAF6_9CHLR|nr:response regulator transcription factor [Dehalogenimonas sp.]